MTTIARNLLDAARDLAPETVRVRRQIHSCPELLYDVPKTAALVAAELRSLGIEVQTGVGQSGVVGLLRGRPGKTVLLRADMDCLQITETSDISYRSQNPGLMHACGHDAHTAMLLSAAKLLAGEKDLLQGNVKFMFQPAEEGGRGALKMIEDGVLANPQVDAAFALHVDAMYYAGDLAIRSGPTQASADRFTITVHGKGGHAGYPHHTVDPVLVASHIVIALQSIVSRETPPWSPVVLTIGKIAAGTINNVIPDDAVILGTMRAFDTGVRDFMKRRIGEVAEGVAGAMRATATIERTDGCPSLYNHPLSVALVTEALHDLAGPEGIYEREPEMGGEDFAFLTDLVPGAMWRLGVRSRDWDEPRSLHTAGFDLDESALPLGVATLAATALRYLES